MLEPSVQERYAPQNICFGCGPANAQGLRIRSFVAGDELVCSWRAQAHHEAFPGVLNGGIIGTLLDCHSNWSAAMHLMRQSQTQVPPCTVTAWFHVKLKRPTPSGEELLLRARIVASKQDRAEVEATLHAAGELCASCSGLFVAVQPGHPAYHRW